MGIGKELTQRPLREVCYCYLLQKKLVEFKVGRIDKYFTLTDDGEKLFENLKGTPDRSKEDAFLFMLLSNIKKYMEIATTIKMKDFSEMKKPTESINKGDGGI